MFTSVKSIVLLALRFEMSDPWSLVHGSSCLFLYSWLLLATAFLYTFWFIMLGSTIPCAFALEVNWHFQILILISRCNNITFYYSTHILCSWLDWLDGPCLCLYVFSPLPKLRTGNQNRKNSSFFTKEKLIKNSRWISNDCIICHVIERNKSDVGYMLLVSDYFILPTICHNTICIFLKEKTNHITFFH